MREEARLEKLEQDSSDAQKCLKIIENISKHINKNIEEYNQYQLSNTNKAVVAYVMLRSMEGKDRLTRAYRVGRCRRWCATNCCC